MLRSGGRLLVLEFSRVAEPLRKPYDWYSFQVLPRLGQWVAGDGESYRYLAESIRMHPDQAELKALMAVRPHLLHAMDGLPRQGFAADLNQADFPAHIVCALDGERIDESESEAAPAATD